MARCFFGAAPLLGRLSVRTRLIVICRRRGWQGAACAQELESPHHVLVPYEDCETKQFIRAKLLSYMARMNLTFFAKPVASAGDVSSSSVALREPRPAPCTHTAPTS